MLANPLLQIVFLFACIVVSGLVLTFVNDLISYVRGQRRGKAQSRRVVFAALPAPKRQSDDAAFKVITVRTRAQDSAASEWQRAA